MESDFRIPKKDLDKHKIRIYCKIKNKKVTGQECWLHWLKIREGSQYASRYLCCLANKLMTDGLENTPKHDDIRAVSDSSEKKD